MRKHQRRNNYDQERASATAVRNAQSGKPQKRKPLPPELQELLDCYRIIKSAHMQGQPTPLGLEERYSTLLTQAKASVA